MIHPWTSCKGGNFAGRKFILYATTLKGKVNDTTNRLGEKLDPSPIPFEKVYEYVISDTPGYIYNRYTAYLFMYARMLENVKRQYQNLKNDIDDYVEKKRRELL